MKLTVAAFFILFMVTAALSQAGSVRPERAIQTAPATQIKDYEDRISRLEQEISDLRRNSPDTSRPFGAYAD